MSAPYISIPEGLPGIRGPLSLRPEVAKPLSALAEVVMRADHSLTRGERELIAGYVSYLNNCHFCDMAHSSVAQYYLQCSFDFISTVKSDFNKAEISDKLKTFLAIAGSVVKGGKHVTTEQVEKAKALGATDLEIHDVVLIAAMFCMFNRYTDGLNTWAPADPEFYKARAPQVARDGYTIKSH
ncbi:MAG TPA: peroxidase-related enzyme [Cyclobacteriaceae bacterium]|nr:peroxidase-related enzyme [Cytophagales bacterium]HRE67659.1 peroxidase-related enzyme [Cyclobacteriaceae bacterium]HRF33812.1 peroxidase-related enzyme [Cyclobacteriaceae bacterium]